jgi:hypothetical protein
MHVMAVNTSFSHCCAGLFTGAKAVEAGVASRTVVKSGVLCNDISVE